MQEPNQPTRLTWREFCQELPLTEVELAQWNQITLESTKDEELFKYLFNNVRSEDITGDGWWSVVCGSDNMRRMKRKEIELYKRWQQLRKRQTTLPGLE